MKEFRYEAIDAHGQPIHGIQAAEDQDALYAILSRRGHDVISVITVEIPQHTNDMNRIPARLSELRITDTVSTAYLTQLPTDVVLRAAAQEPVWNPAAALLRWAQMFVLVLLVVCALHAVMVGAVSQPLLIAAAIALLVWGPGWLLVRSAERRPQRLLEQMAAALRSGQGGADSVSHLLPGQLSEIAECRLPEEKKMLAISELLSGTTGVGMARYRLFLDLLGPVCLLAAAVSVCYAFLALVVPAFKEIFEGFGLDLPWVTQLIIDISGGLEALGVPGAIAIALGAAGLVTGLYFVVHRGWLNELLASMPLMGVVLNWLNLAGVARWLAALLRNDAAPDDALRVAVTPSRSAGIRRDGKQLATLIGEGRLPSNVRTSLSGLPLSLLFGLGGEPQGSRRRSAVASTLDGLALMFERATSSTGRILASILQLVILVIVAGLVGVTILALFLPLVMLLNDLS